MKKSISGFMILFLTAVFSFNAKAAPGDLFVQVHIVVRGPTELCSIMKVMPDGSFTEVVSADDILTLTGLSLCNMVSTGLTVAANGEIYFSEDDSISIIKISRSGELSTFVSESDITAVTGESTADPDYGLVIGPDGDLYFNDATSDSILKATIPHGVVSFVVTEEEIEAVTGNTDADLSGGIAFDCEGNLYITDQPEDDPGSILILTPQGSLSIFVTEEEINNATGFGETALNRAIAFYESLYVLDDGDCKCVLEITPGGDISVFLSEDQITDATGNLNAELEGGIALNQFREVFIGDDGSDDPNLLMSPRDGSSVSVLVTAQAIDDFYVDAGFPVLEGSMAFEGVNVCSDSEVVPTVSEWGLIAMAGILGIAGFMVLRRRKLTA